MKGKYILFTLLFFAANFSFSQQTDFKLWTGVGIKAPAFKVFDFSVEVQERLENNFLDQDRVFIQTGIEYDMFDNIEIGGGYRYIIANSKTYGYKNEHRFHADIQYSRSVRRFEFRVRSRVQYGNPEILVSDFIDNEAHNRYLFEIEYNIYRSPITPKVGYEFYYQLNNYRGNRIDQNRYIVEADIRLGFHGELNIFYIFENEININEPEDSNIIGIAYEYDF